MSDQFGATANSWNLPLRTRTLARSFDIVLALIGLLLLSPVFLVIAVAIELDDGGPVFYRQARIGKDFQPFQLYKFRSMIVDAHHKGLLTAARDSRVTRIGRFLRHYKLDELPQLFNVLKGDMQFVGARPEVERYVLLFRPQYTTILQERPGITDPASLAYRREEQMLSAERAEEQYVQDILPEKLRLSLAYQEKRTLLSDVRIVLKTVLGFTTS